MQGFTSRENRILKKNQLVGVHWNSHQNVYSVVEFSSRKTSVKVLGYVDRITLKDCSIKIDKSKQKSVKEKGTKDRHAFIVGFVEEVGKIERFPKKIYYSPHKLDSFVDADKFFNGEILYLANMKKVNLDYDFENKKPNVTYC